MKPPELTEPELVERLREGDRDALGQIYILYRDSVCNYCHCLVKEKDRVEDVVHETFVKVWNNIGSLRNSESFRSWIFMIARNQALLDLRDRKRFEELTDESSIEHDSPLVTLISAEESVQVKGLLDALRRPYRELIVLRVYGGLSYAELARVTGLSRDAVRVHLFRARKTLAKLYDENFGGKHE
jgi:RNA polymerase sigma-70 factor (ECF subfamily)